ncbi:MAG: hypothetical protein ACQEWV_28440, partial [Bacillota bacterium]
IAYLNEEDLNGATESISKAKNLEPNEPEIRETFGRIMGKRDSLDEVERLRAELQTLKAGADAKVWEAFSQFSQQMSGFSNEIKQVKELTTKNIDIASKNLEVSSKNLEVTMELKADIQNIFDNLNQSLMIYREELLQTVHEVEQRAEILSKRILLRIDELFVNLDQETQDRVEEGLSDYYGQLWNNMQEIRTFLITAEIVYRYMENRENLDFSPAVIPITKALESLLNEKVYSRIRTAIIPGDRMDIDKFKKIRDKNGQILETVTIGDAIHMFKDRDVINLAHNLGIFKEDITRVHYFTNDDRFIGRWPSSTLNLNPITLKGKLNLIREEYRNKVAHNEGIPLVTAQACRSYMIYGEAFLKELLGKLNL